MIVQNEHQPEGFRKMDNPAIRKGLERISTSLNNIGDSFERAYEVIYQLLSV